MKLNTILLVVAGILIATGTVMLFFDSNNYQAALTESIIEAQQATLKPTSGIYAAKWQDHEKIANNMRIVAKERYETERTKDFLIIGAGVFVGIAGIAVRNKSRTTH